MKKVLIIVFSNLKHDARVSRQVKWLKKENAVTIICFDADAIPDVNIIKIKQTKLTLFKKAILGAALILRQYHLAYRIFHDYGYLTKNAALQNFDLIIANDIDALPLAFELKNNAKIIFDAHEYSPRHFENNKVWKTFFQPFYVYLCKLYISKADGMLTVGEGLANEYAKNFGVKPLIVTNATQFYDISPVPVLSNKIRLIHHGIANQSRRLELMFEMMEHLDERFTLDMILMTSDFASGKTRTYINSLKDRASQNSRIKILPAVKSHEVVQTINQYDMGVFLIPPVNFNYANTLPNKLFDFIQARLGIAIGPTPEMAKIVHDYNLGVVAEDFDPLKLALQLNKLSQQDVVQFKKQATVAAHVLNAEKNEEQLIQYINKMF